MDWTLQHSPSQINGLDVALCIGLLFLYDYLFRRPATSNTCGAGDSAEKREVVRPAMSAAPLSPSIARRQRAIALAASRNPAVLRSGVQCDRWVAVLAELDDADTPEQGATRIAA
jgi:hypothetical protein